MKIALVHDDFIQMGGAESLFATIASLYPKAPIFTSLVDWQKLPLEIEKRRIKPSFMQKIPFATKLYKLLLIIYPIAFESFDFSSYDLVISSTTRFAKSIITQPHTNHICYINNIPRFLWEEARSDYLTKSSRFFLKPCLGWLKRFDKTSARRVDLYLANSQNIAKKVKKHYLSDAHVVYPFVNLDLYKPPKIHNWQLKSQNYLLVVSRLVKWKKLEIAIIAAIHLKMRLKIVGVGPDKNRLQKIAQTKDIEFLGRVNTHQFVELYQNAQALIVTQEEDFGLSALEAQACGLPVVFYKEGGVSEIVIDGKTGILFSSQTPKACQDAIMRLKDVKWNVQEVAKRAKKFTKSAFLKNLKLQISSL